MGKHLVHSLIADKHDVTIATRGITPDDFSCSVKRVIIDRSSSDSIRNVLSESKYDVVYDNLVYCSNDVKVILDNLTCEKYIFLSSTAVYDKHHDIREDEYNPSRKSLVWCNRYDFPYDEAKRQAECAIAHEYPHIKYIAARFPFVLGIDDYTKRLYFYIENILNKKPMFIDNYENQMSFVRSDEAGKFLAFLAACTFNGAINGASEQTISIKEIADYVKVKTGKSAIISSKGNEAPYNGEKEYSINTNLSKSLGFSFTPLKNWIFELIDYYIKSANS